MVKKQTIKRKPFIGVFWVYQGQVIGQTTEISEGSQALPGLVDPEDTHVQVWEDKKHFTQTFPELADQEYQNLPRGRVLYQARANKPLIYLDASLMKPETKQKIADFFGFDKSKANWQHDLHYTTDTETLSHLFDDSDLD